MVKWGKVGGKWGELGAGMGETGGNGEKWGIVGHCQKYIVEDVLKMWEPGRKREKIWRTWDSLGQISTFPQSHFSHFFSQPIHSCAPSTHAHARARTRRGCSLPRHLRQRLTVLLQPPVPTGTCPTTSCPTAGHRFVCGVETPGSVPIQAQALPTPMPTAMSTAVPRLCGLSVGHISVHITTIGAGRKIGQCRPVPKFPFFQPASSAGKIHQRIEGGRRVEGGVWDAKGCASKMAQINVSFVNCILPTMKSGSRGGSSYGCQPF